MQAKVFSSDMKRPVVFYDGSCPLCSREIKYYRGLSGAEAVEWIDVTRDVDSLNKYALSKEKAMARFHVMDRYGEWQTGAWGFVELWSYLSFYRWVSKLVRMLRLTGLMDKVYTWFAAWRLRKSCTRGHCQLASNKTKN